MLISCQGTFTWSNHQFSENRRNDYEERTLNIDRSIDRTPLVYLHRVRRRMNMLEEFNLKWEREVAVSDVSQLKDVFLTRDDKIVIRSMYDHFLPSHVRVHLKEEYRSVMVASEKQEGKEARQRCSIRSMYTCSPLSLSPSNMIWSCRIMISCVNSPRHQGREMNVFSDRSSRWSERERESQLLVRLSTTKVNQRRCTYYSLFINFQSWCAFSWAREWLM